MLTTTQSSKEREENLRIIYSQKEKEFKDLTKKLKDLKAKLWEAQNAGFK